ncbi:2-polyprenyl-6-methoxyphenol hydroxylase-like FAD-dependent oxidoreductase [Sinobacterium caligoides]|uniref:2-polyprenyl-6-methoxyphenol hydroxylase-like FAD-dependent oxidoreductase n=1 Tax=Sinobacterium caligoides TaxID=933926 RepID=A0A3N2E011_9GAMM|nr:FAD-dependent monooxygenase [Sinobacterium caligoides]ROS05430.1 2-polyprenyl-6-methoxyphenol hydroxylase-like FAD-dependent oxidoreductase [Sinobacterium caligoides]
MVKLSIGIIGGSIAGCAAAVALGRAGHDVQVFERSAGRLESRGVGITIPSTVIDSLKEKQLIDDDFPCFETEQLSYHVQDSASPEYGRSPYVMQPETRFKQFNWSDLWRALRSRVPENSYFDSQCCIEIRNNDDYSEVVFSDNSSQRFDLVIFADGYRSMARQLLFPSQPLNYAGYVAWRGVLEERYLTTSEPLEKGTALVWRREGQSIFYFVPSPKGGVGVGERWVNWVVYMPVDKEQWSHYLSDQSDHDQVASLPPGLMSNAAEEALKQRVTAELPDYYARIINSSEHTFMQPIYDVCLPDYRQQRVCLIGDAATLARPHAGSGVMKGVDNALSLAEMLAQTDDIEAALDEWSSQQADTAQQSYLLSRKLGQAFVQDVPDIASFSEEQIINWLYESVA